MTKKIVLPPEEWNKLQSIEKPAELALAVLNDAYGPFYRFDIDDIRVIENTCAGIIVWWGGTDDHDCFVRISFNDADTYNNAIVLIDFYQWDYCPVVIEYSETKEIDNA